MPNLYTQIRQQYFKIDDNFLVKVLWLFSFYLTYLIWRLGGEEGTLSGGGLEDLEFDSVSAPESQATAPGNGNAVSDVVSVAVAAAPGAAAASKPTSQVTPSKFQEFYPLN